MMSLTFFKSKKDNNSLTFSKNFRSNKLFSWVERYNVVINNITNARTIISSLWGKEASQVKGARMIATSSRYGILYINLLSMLSAMQYPKTLFVMSTKSIKSLNLKILKSG